MTDDVRIIGATVRRGITIDGIDVVLVALNTPDVEAIAELTLSACATLGTACLRRSFHARPDSPDPVLAVPVSDRGRLLGFVELAP